MKLETKARKTLEYIKIRESRGYTVPESLKIKANRIIAGDYTKKEIPHLNDMMTRDMVRTLSKGKGYEIYNRLDWMMRNHPSRERARDVIGFVQELEIMSKTDILPKGKTTEQLRVNAMKYVPKPDQIDKLLEKADDLDIPFPAGLRFENVIRQEWSQYGEGEEGFTAYRHAAERRGYEIFKANHLTISLKSIEKLMDFVDHSRNWEKFRRRIKSDEFMMDLGDIFDEIDAEDEMEVTEEDLNWLDRQLEVSDDVKRILNEYIKRKGMDWEV